MNRLGIFAALTGFLAVALGAFGAHALDGQLTPEGLDWWHTATLYALPHAAPALAISLHAKTGLVRKAGWAFVFGTIVFAGSLYAMALGAPRWFGAITPIGGISYLVGWACCALGARKA